MSEVIAIVIVLGTAFFAGFGWGLWRAESVIRAERTTQEAGRISVSMPAHKDDAAGMMRLLADLFEQTREQKGQP